MPFASRLATLFSWKPLAVGQPSPPLSLTADEGTWVKVRDFVGHTNTVLLFFGSLRDEATEAWLKRWQAARDRFEALETAIFGVNTARTDKLREFRNRLGLEFYLLYDPLGWESRGFHAASRIRPSIKPNVVVLDKKATVVFASRGMVDPDPILPLIASLEGKDLAAQPEAPRPAVAGVRNPGQGAAPVQHIDSLKAESLLKQKDSPYILVDVRTLSEYEPDHSPYARHLPVDELPHRYQELGQQNHLVFVCQAGGRSQAAAEFMASIGGTEIYSVTGGMANWKGERVTGGRA